MKYGLHNNNNNTNNNPLTLFKNHSIRFLNTLLNELTNETNCLQSSLSSLFESLVHLNLNSSERTRLSLVRNACMGTMYMMCCFWVWVGLFYVLLCLCKVK